MKTVAAFVVLACAAPAIVAQQMMVNSLTDVVQCQPAQITWQGGAPPYYVSLIPAGQPSASPIKQFDQQNGNSLTWTVDLDPGTAFTTELKDSTGAVVYSGEQTIMSGGSDVSCTSSSMSMSMSMSATSGFTASSASSTLPPAASQGAAFAATTSASSGAPTASRSMSANVTTSHTSSSAATTATQATKNSASGGYATVGVIGLTGLLGFVGYAMF